MAQWRLSMRSVHEVLRLHPRGDQRLDSPQDKPPILRGRVGSSSASRSPVNPRSRRSVLPSRAACRAVWSPG